MYMCDTMTGMTSVPHIYLDIHKYTLLFIYSCSILNFTLCFQHLTELYKDKIFMKRSHQVVEEKLVADGRSDVPPTV